MQYPGGSITGGHPGGGTAEEASYGHRGSFLGPQGALPWTLLRAAQLTMALSKVPCAHAHAAAEVQEAG